MLIFENFFLNKETASRKSMAQIAEEIYEKHLREFKENMEKKVNNQLKNVNDSFATLTAQARDLKKVKIN